MMSCKATAATSLWRPLLLILFSVVVSGCQTADSTWTRIQETGVLRVGLDPTYPPFELADGIPLEGFDVDLARAVAETLGLEAEFTYFGYDGLYDALATEQVDVLISALVIVPERRRDFAYSEPYFNAGEILVVHEEESAVSQMADLDGRTLAVELGARGHVEATEWARRLANLTITPYPTPDAALAAVAEGEADAALVDGISGRLFLKDNPALRRTAEPVTVEPYAMVVRIESERLLEKLDGALAELVQSGRLEAIQAEWLGR